MQVEIIVDFKFKNAKRDLPAIPRIGDRIIDSELGEHKVRDVIWFTDTDLVKIYVRR